MTPDNDQGDLSDRELILTRIFDAPPEKVFRAWTEPEWLMQWFAPSALDHTPRRTGRAPRRGQCDCHAQPGR